MLNSIEDLAAYRGQIWNAVEFARSLGCGEATARSISCTMGRNSQEEHRSSRSDASPAAAATRAAAASTAVSNTAAATLLVDAQPRHGLHEVGAEVRPQRVAVAVLVEPVQPGLHHVLRQVPVAQERRREAEHPWPLLAGERVELAPGERLRGRGAAGIATWLVRHDPAPSQTQTQAGHRRHSTGVGGAIGRGSLDLTRLYHTPPGSIPLIGRQFAIRPIPELPQELR